MPVEIISFEEAIAETDCFRKRNLLLGNGFSIGCRASIFHYESLFGQADFTKFPELREVFEIIRSADFEEAIRLVERSAHIMQIYAPQFVDAVDTMLAQAAALKEILVSTIAGSHPARPNDISHDEYLSAKRFLSHFIGEDKGGDVFTLNYDLLLYWTLMHDFSDADDVEDIPLNKNDGFGDDDVVQQYVVWKGEYVASKANIFYLHGALHLFDDGDTLQKYTWIRSGDALIDQTRAALASDKFPLFVSEGTSAKKMSKIRHNAYLHQSLRKLSGCLGPKTQCFFIYGHSLADNDDHILRKISTGKCPALYVSIFGDPASGPNQQIINKAHRIADRRDVRYPLHIRFYDAASARVWG